MKLTPEGLHSFGGEGPLLDGIGSDTVKVVRLSKVDSTFGGEGTFLDEIGSDSGDLALSRTSDSDLIFSQTQLKLIRLFPRVCPR